MIGTVLCCVLHPLSRYLTSVSSDASLGMLHPALVNCCTQCQQAPLDQQSSEMEKSGGKKAHKVSPSSEESSAGPMIGKPSSKKDVEYEGGSFHRQGGINTEQELGLLLKYLQMDGGTREESTITVHRTSLAERIQEQVHVPRGVEETLDGAEHDKTVCWDEQIAVPDAKETPLGEMSSYPPFKSQGQRNDVQVNWHFPTGPGLMDEVPCPLWPPPLMSYYPVLETRGPIKVEWRIWEESEERATLLPFAGATMDFTVMSYNVLADDLLMGNLELYAHCPPEVLDWSYRCNLLLGEILKWTPDILCLQEVQGSHYHSYFYPALSQRGYTCAYKQRTGSKTDGCATCFHTSRFTEVSVTPLEYFRPDVKVLDRHNVGMVSLLRPVVTCGSKVTAAGPPLCVANTHLLFNPKRGDVKLAQLAVMLAEIDEVVKSCHASGELCNVVLCGDFNSLPHSPVYEFITTGELYFQGLPAWTISGQEDLSQRVYCSRLYSPLWPSCLRITHDCQYQAKDRASKSLDETPAAVKHRYTHHFLLQLRFIPAACVRPVDLELIPGVTDSTPEATKDHHQHLYNKSFGPSLYHGLDLKSVYQHTVRRSAAPEVTTQQSQFGATVDYIFYNPKRVSTTDKEDTLWSLKGLPNYNFPSDHLSLLAKFQMDLNAQHEVMI